MKRLVANVNGIVQGVGFRPYIHKLVDSFNMYGIVKNTSKGVFIELEGQQEELLKFIDELKNNSPKLSLIESIEFDLKDELKGYRNFEIIESSNDINKFTLISPDLGICDDCLKELLDPQGRRYRHPFINCTNCGPRFTIIKDIPYDRNKTTMDDFKICEECYKEYKDIRDRRYHAQPNSCYECGPKLYFFDDENNEIKGDPISAAKEFIKQGKIIAIKGLGGFHLTCDANNKQAVMNLRQLKRREEKPFAIMCKDIETIKKHGNVSKEEEELLMSYKKPIVLLEKKEKTLDGISNDNKYIGVMMPYTPIHHLLMEDGIEALVMTSGNITDTPIISDNNEARIELKGIADGYLLNNRDIHIKCDDSLLMIIDGNEYPFRRSRGYVPYPIKLKSNVGNILATGGEQKASFALSKGQYVFVSQHIGDMKNIETFEHYQNQIEHFKRLFDIEEETIACDLHPDYMSTDFAETIHKNQGKKLVYVQHHHGHMASCMADNNLNEKVIGIIWDGTGYGMDSTIWGGEFLVGDYSEFERMGRIKPIPLPGGEKAIKDIYRLGYSLIKSSLGFIPSENIKTQDAAIIEKMIDSKINTPLASSIGRLFDGVSSLLGFKDNVAYEGQGAIILEFKGIETKEFYEYSIDSNLSPLEFNWSPMIKGIIKDLNEGVDPGICAMKFMNTLVKMAVEMAEKISLASGIKKVVLSGGVFQNKYILTTLKDELKKVGFEVYNHRRVATNDEGLSLGQLVVAANGGGVKCV